MWSICETAKWHGMWNYDHMYCMYGDYWTLVMWRPVWEMVSYGICYEHMYCMYGNYWTQVMWRPVWETAKWRYVKLRSHVLHFCMVTIGHWSCQVFEKLQSDSMLNCDHLYCVYANYWILVIRSIWELRSDDMWNCDHMYCMYGNYWTLAMWSIWEPSEWRYVKFRSHVLHVW